MEIEPAASRLKIDIDIEVNGQTAFRAHVDAEGDAQSLRPVAEQLSASIAQAIARVIGSSSSGEVSAQSVAPSIAAAQLTPPVVANLLVPISQLPAASRQPARSVLPAWLTDNRRLTLGFGGVLVLAAILVAIVFPPVVPPAQRIEVFMMSLAFGLIGSATLFAGALPKRTASSKLAANTNASASSATALSTALSTTSSTFASSSSQATAQSINKPNGAKSRLVLDARRRALLQAQESRKPLGALWGFGFGVLFLVAGIVAPFVLGQANADERFLMMLGFAPVAVTGALMIGLFWRTLSRVATPDGKTTGPAAFRIGVPVAIGILLVVLFVVIGLVLLATLLPILSR